MRDLRSGLDEKGTCPGFELRRFHAGELPDPEAAKVEAHLASCRRCAARVASLDEEAAEFHGRSFDDFSRAVESRLPRVRAEAAPPRRRRSRLLAAAAPLALAAGLALVLGARALLGPPADDGIRLKGGADVAWIVGGEGPTRIAVDGEHLAPGERVRLELAPGDWAYVLAVSVDGRGDVSPLYDDGGRSLRVEPGSRAVLPDSIAFDGAGAERLYVIFSAEPVTVDEAAGAARTALSLAGSVPAMGELPGVGDEQATLHLVKP